MPSESSNTSSPRSILKRPTPVVEVPMPRTESKQLLRIDPGLFQPIVRFPSTSSLTCTFLVHSAATYDRSPIDVGPNQLALPERGCPGRTYTAGEERLSAAKELASRNNGGRKLRGRSPIGRHLRRRVSRVSIAVEHGEGHAESEQEEGEETHASNGCDDSPHETPPSSPPSARSSPRIPPRSISISPSDIASSLAAMCINPRARPASPFSLRHRNFMSFSRSSSPASSCATSPASSRSSSPCNDVLVFTTPSARNRRNLNAKPRRSRSFINDTEVRLASFEENSLLSLDGPDGGCLGGF